MPVSPASALAFKASRTKIYFPAWQPPSLIGATAARSSKNRFIRVGFETQIPSRLSVNTEYFNADVFFTSGPLARNIIHAFDKKDEIALERLLMISLFIQGPAIWQSGEHKPSPSTTKIENPTIEKNSLFWSGLDPTVWSKIADTTKNSKTTNIDDLDEIIANGIRNFAEQA